MALTSDTNRSPANGGYACNGSVTEFAGTFRILAEDQIAVTITDSDGNDSVLTLSTDYTVTPSSLPADSFTVTTVQTYDSGNTIAITRAVPYTQDATYGNSGPYLPKIHETSYDKLTMQTQELVELVNRCVKYPAGADLSTVTIVLDEDGSVIISYLQDGAVTTAKINNGAVTTAKIAADAVDKTKLAADVAGLGITQATGGELDVNVDDSTLEVDTDTVRVKDAGITLAKMEARSANTILGSIAGGTPEEISCTSAGRALIDDASASAQRTTLGLGDVATLDIGTTAGTAAAGDDSRFADGDAVAKGWVDFDPDDGGSPSINDSYNVASITDNGTGDFSVVWDTDFANTNYAAVCTTEGGSGASSGSFIQQYTSGKAVGSFRLETKNVSGLTMVDTANVSVVAFGDQ